MDPNTPIMIDGFTGGPDGVDLEKCFFLETDPGLFQLFAPDQLFAPCKSPITTEPTVIPNGSFFTFNFGFFAWTAAFVYSDPTGVGAGVWSAVRLKGPEDPESGTFQAQAGLGTGNELEASASASA